MLRIHFLKKLASCESGATAIIFALVLIPMFFCVGAAIDYSRINSSKAAMQEHLDAAILAGTVQKDLEPKERIEAAKAYFYATLPHDLRDYARDLQVALTPDEDGLRGDIALNMPTSFMRILGTDDMGVVLASQTNITQRNRQLDMVFCIDATGSMQEEIDGVTNAAYSLQENINAKLKADDKAEFDAMRVRVIFFRDFGTNFGSMDTASATPAETETYGDSEAMQIPAMNRSGRDFMSLPRQSGAFRSFLDTENANSAYDDEPEAGFVCLNEALESDFAKVGDPLSGDPSKKISSVTPLVAIWTDANARPINDPRARDLPRSQPRSYEDLKAKWDDADKIDQKNKLLVFFGDLDRACATEEEQGGTTIASSSSSMSDVTGSVSNADCPAGGVARWRESIGTWGLGKTLYNYSLAAATNNLAAQIADAISQQPATPRLTR